jgi:hypothetical protein
MPKIPLYTHEPQSLGTANVRADPNLLSAQSEGAAKLGQGLASVGQAATDFAVRKMDALNFARMADSERKMKEGFLLFQDELARNGNEKEWGQLWEARAAEIEQEVMGKDVPAVLKPQLKAQLDGWKMMTKAAVRSAATNREIERAGSEVLASVETDLKTGDVELAVSKLRGAEAQGLIGPAKATAAIAAIPGKVAHYDATRLILTSPVEALDALKARNEKGEWTEFTALDEPQRKSLVDSANVAVQKVRAETYQGLIERMNAGEIIGQDELNALVESKMFTATQARDILRNQSKDGSNLPTGQETKFARLLTDIANYDPTRDASNERYANLAAQVAVLPSGFKEDAYGRLKDKANPKSASNAPVAMFGKDLINDAFKSGVYGVFESERFGRGGKEKVIDQAIYAEAVQSQAKALDAIAEFLSKKPNATREEVTKEVLRINQSFVDRQIRSVISGGRDPLTLVIRQREEMQIAEAKARLILEKHQ